MGGSFEAPSSSFSCKMRIIQGKTHGHPVPPSSGRYFLWQILSAEKDRLVHLETREMPLFDSTLDWKESIELLKHPTVAFELRRRNKVSGLGRFLRTGSKLLGRGEAPWKEVFESPQLGVDTWAKMVFRDSRLRGCNDPPSLRIAMKLTVDGNLKGKTVKKGREDKARNYYYCCCDDCNGYIGTLDYDVFALVAALLSRTTIFVYTSRMFAMKWKLLH